MASWQSVVAHPLGLAAYSISCVFGLVARFGPTGQYPWLAPSAVTMACVALGVALLITLRQNSRKTHKSQTSRSSLSNGASSPVVQKTRGIQSPAIANVKGSISIDYSETGRGKT